MGVALYKGRMLEREEGRDDEWRREEGRAEDEHNNIASSWSTTAHHARARPWARAHGDMPLPSSPFDFLPSSSLSFATTSPYLGAIVGKSEPRAQPKAKELLLEYPLALGHNPASWSAGVAQG